MTSATISTLKDRSLHLITVLNNRSISRNYAKLTVMSKVLLSNDLANV